MGAELASVERRERRAVSEFTFVTWDGGGNVAVASAIAVELRARGHHVTIAGPRSLEHSVGQLTVGYVELGILPPRNPKHRGAYLLDVAQGTDSMLDRLRRLGENTDVLVIDCNLSWALQSRLASRTAVLVHTALGIYLPVWQEVLDTANARRNARGLAVLAPAADSWAWPDLLLVVSSAQFDRPLRPGRLHPVYVGPVSAPLLRKPDPSATLPSSGRRSVLISYSTDALQNTPGRLQTALDALADLPVAVIATTSGAFARHRLRVPPNATVTGYLPHDSVIGDVALVVCHAGHGTTMAALVHGVPLVCVPGIGRDQEPIATRVSELGLGVAVRRDATAAEIRDAATTILSDHGFVERARAFAQQAGTSDGAQGAASALLGLLDAPSDA
jgi:UDP:flavonoid glycosyltransferase YjiC (YdhE family)